MQCARPTPLRQHIIAGALLALKHTGSAVAASETEFNDTFDSRTLFDPGILTADGSLDRLINPNDADFVLSGMLNSGATTPHTIPGQPPGAAFFGALDNTSRVDTLLGTFDESGLLLDIDDDGSPFGDGFADALNATVNADGSIRFGMTGFPDDTFTGAHEQTSTSTLIRSSPRTSIT